MIIKAEVTPEEKSLIQSFAKAEGKSMAAYLKSRALYSYTEHSPEALMQCVEVLSNIAHDINRLATTIFRNKAIYEEEILELLDRMTSLEQTTAEALKEVRKDGNPRKQKHKGNAPGGREVQQQSRQESTA